MKTVNISGKPYVMVNERVKEFRVKFPDWSLTTEVIEITEQSIILKAIITDPEGRVIAQGMAREVEGSTSITKTSHVEVCETSAWGRALGNLGIGIDASMASADEVANAILNQEPENHMGVSIKERELAKQSYHVYCNHLEEFFEGASQEEWEKFKTSATATSKDDKWNTGNIETFRKRVERKEQELSF